MFTRKVASAPPAWASLIFSLAQSVKFIIKQGCGTRRYIESNQKQPSCKKGAAPKKAMVKKDVKSKVAAKKWL